MSLRPDSGRPHLGRSRSRSRDDRERPHSNVRLESESKSTTKSQKSKEPHYVNDNYDDDDDDAPSIAMPTMPGTFDEANETHHTRIRRPSGRGKRNNEEERTSNDDSDNEPDSHPRGQATWQPLHDRKHSGDVIRSKGSSRVADDLAYGDSSGIGLSSPGIPYPHDDAFGFQYPDEDSPATPRARMPSFSGYANPEQYQYTELPEKLTYRAKSSPLKEYRQTAEPIKPKMPTRNVSFAADTQARDVKHTDERRSNHASRLSVSEPRAEIRAPSPAGRLGSGMNRLSINTGHADGHGFKGAAPPASPLLEAYHGTYQSISPMPSPIVVPQLEDLEDVESLEPLSNEEDLGESGARERAKAKNKLEKRVGKKHVTLYDAEGDAEKIKAALNHHEARPGPLIDILPQLTHDQLLALRNAYKKHNKIQGRGVNVAKQISATTTGNFSKVCYATALGRWESEAYWANFWYQAHSSNRELLIEALMGRSNADIREIKDGFRDKRYHDDLSLCMQKELKPDKFRSAVLMALEGERQEETDTWPVEYRNKDVETLHRALRSKEGGETAILKIVVTRSNNHLREVLKTFERVHQENLARAALKKSTNLVVSMLLWSLFQPKLI